MYLPKHFQSDNSEALFELIERYSFVLMISMDDSGEPFINPLPVYAEKSGEKIRIFGHFAKRNPQAGHLRARPRATIVVNGPHTYITPTWYSSGRDVPTWNYVVAQLSGAVRLIEDFEGLCEILKKITSQYESGRQNPWEFELPADLENPEDLTSAIIGFELQVEKIEAKFKLSQNRPVIDQEGVLQGLALQDDEMSQAVMQMMQKNRTKN